MWHARALKDALAAWHGMAWHGIGQPGLAWHRAAWHGMTALHGGLLGQLRQCVISACMPCQLILLMLSSMPPVKLRGSRVDGSRAFVS